MQKEGISALRPDDLEGRGAERLEREKEVVFEAVEEARRALDVALEAALYALTGPMDPRIVEALERAGLEPPSRPLGPALTRAEKGVAWALDVLRDAEETDERKGR